MQPARILRVIARLNVGGPAYHVSILGGRLDPTRYESLLVYGAIGRGEASLEEVVRSQVFEVEELAVLGPEIRPLADLRALWALVRLIRRVRPDLVETHTAKAGFLGRAAAVIATRPRPIIVHTYHGHVLEGYFGPVQNALYRALERALARVSDCLVCVSERTAADLVRLGIAPRERFRVIPLGLDLERFVRLSSRDGGPVRLQVGARPDELILLYVGRLVPIKRIDVIIRALAELERGGVRVRFLVVGGGESREELEELAERLGVADRVAFLGYMIDVTPVLAACDVAVLSSENEGTPVSLIEAAAAGRPAVATAVGGVPEVVTPQSGILVPPGDPQAFAAAVARLAADRDFRAAAGTRARRHVLHRFSTSRLVADIEDLYDGLLSARAVGLRAAR
jgi:glycosyltransferase involved in cell wall biosynthesis